MVNFSLSVNNSLYLKGKFREKEVKDIEGWDIEGEEVMIPTPSVLHQDFGFLVYKRQFLSKIFAL